ncbi:MAG: dTDP-4-dehydrorhamnose reductase [Prevotellaceae bacterium]|jgi:dTDP-4-dehydrorhamnose reductase|nr:dTDP-4-dehydrorhamnose reductase [Prevotellaceae bacterium]
MKKILITGANGQLGNEMRVLSAQYPQYEYIFTDVAELDICNKAAVLDFISAATPDFIVNCAAYTAVTKAEEETAPNYAINRDAIRNLGEAAVKTGAQLIHISTDYVFDGKGYLPYTEDMPVNPESAYGKAKAEGEKALMSVCKESIILRTSWLYSSFGNNFVKTMLKLGREKEKLTVIFDQIGTPTYAADLASAIMQIINSGKFESGIYHFSDEGVCSWYDFAKAIHKLSGITSSKVLPLETKDYPDKTPRPFYSVLNKAKIKTVYELDIPHWEESLERCLAILEHK